MHIYSIHSGFMDQSLKTHFNPCAQQLCGILVFEKQTLRNPSFSATFHWSTSPPSTDPSTGTPPINCLDTTSPSSFCYGFMQVTWRLLFKPSCFKSHPSVEVETTTLKIKLKGDEQSMIIILKKLQRFRYLCRKFDKPSHNSKWIGYWSEIVSKLYFTVLLPM